MLASKSAVISLSKTKPDNSSNLGAPTTLANLHVRIESRLLASNRSVANLHQEQSILPSKACTFDTCHTPSRRVRIPRAVNSAAIALNEV